MRESIEIRIATQADVNRIANLLVQLGYPTEISEFEKRFKRLLKDENELIYVAVIANQVCGFISMHFIPQIAMEGDFARISYFCVDQAFRDQKVGQKLLAEAERCASLRDCDRIELHCAAHRHAAQLFYRKQNYIESAKYLMKKL